ncbi:MAG: hypothetical protein KDC38_15110, partial [Planctomycetes bacterium]|nr:hypothetical protein [Planctomycetota bacterium]
ESTSDATIELSLSATPISSNFIRSDCNADGSTSIADAIFYLSWLFTPGSSIPSCFDACDTNDDGALDVADAISALTFLFIGGLPPQAPYPGCGPDPTVDAQGCAGFSPCP